MRLNVLKIVCENLPENALKLELDVSDARSRFPTHSAREIAEALYQWVIKT